MTAIIYGEERIELSEKEDVPQLKVEIAGAIEATGRDRWIEIVTDTGSVELFVTPGVPIRIDGRQPRRGGAGF